MKFHEPPAMFVDKVTLKVENLERSVRFYEQVIGFKVKESVDGRVSLTADGNRVLVELMQLDKLASVYSPIAGLYHFALLLPSRTDLANVVRHLLTLGVQIGTGDHLVSEAIYLSDPDGNGIEIYADRDPSTWDWEAAEVQMLTKPVDIRGLLSMAGEGDWQGLPNGTIMGHLHLQVANIDDNERFYVDGIGFQIVNRYGSRALFLSDNKYHHHIAFNTWAGGEIQKGNKHTIGLHDYTVLFPSAEVRDRALMRLEKIKAPVEKMGNYYMTKDPSGVQIKLKLYPWS